jgi:hypothetical protein
MKLVHNLFYLHLFFLTLFISQVILAQSFFSSPPYPPRVFRYPLDTTASLVGNFGECRPNHFHSGLDIRTFGKENMKVFAIEDGFVSRIKIEPGGFGNAIFITHFNGYTSLYAHLNRFFPELDEYVKRKQYEAESWALDISLPPHEFPVRKGKMIAWSGNTGSSQGPHLHMEIRDTKTDAPLNGLLFYTGLKDNKPPKIKQIAIYDADKSIYEQQPVFLPVTYKNGIASLAKGIITCKSNRVYFGIEADDFMEIATGTLGVFEMRMYVDNKPYFGWQMDNISYDITRYMNAIADYKVRKQGGPWIQLCHRLPNDNLTVYKSFTKLNGKIELSDQMEHLILIEVYDTKYNKTSLQFTIKSAGKLATNSTCNEFFKAGEINHFKNENMEFTLPKDALYDDICFKTIATKISTTTSHKYQVHTSDVPLHSYFDLKLKPYLSFDVSKRDKLAMVRLPFGKETSKKGKAASWKDGYVVAPVRDFGTYEIVLDTKPPIITSSIKNGDKVGGMKRLTFVVKEETTSVKKVKATLDGKWLRLVQRGDSYTYEMDSHFYQGTHTLVVEAFDENDNQSKTTLTLTK